MTQVPDLRQLAIFFSNFAIAFTAKLTFCPVWSLNALFPFSVKRAAARAIVSGVSPVTLTALMTCG